MDRMREELDTVKKILADSPHGLTITDVSERMGINRNAIAKYLEILRTAGEVEMKPFGRSKYFSLSSRMSFAVALNMSSELIVLVDSGLRVLDTNDQILRFTGLERSMIIGQPMDSIKADILSHPHVLLNIKDALNGKEYVNEISVARGKDRHYFKVKIIPVPMGGVHSRAALIFENITARKTAEIALRESEARYRAVVEDQSEIICRMLPDTTLTFVNEAFCRYFNVSRAETIGKTLPQVVPQAYAHAVRAKLDGIRPDRPTETAESAYQVPGRKMQWVHWTCRGRFDSASQLTEIQVVARDVTDRKAAEAALKESEARYRAVVEDHVDMIVRMLPDTTLTFVNDAWCRFLGMDRSRLIGKRLLDYHKPETRSKIERMLAGIKVENDIGACEEVIRLRDGSRHWVNWTIRGIFDDAGRLSEYQIVARDITELKRAEDALKESEQKFRAAFDQSPIGMSIVGLDMRFLRVNPEFSRIIGYSEDELKAKTFLEITHPLDLETDRRLANDLIAGKSEQYHMEKRYLTKDGRAVWLRKHMRLVLSPDGKPSYILVIYEDITEKKHTEESLKITQLFVDKALDEVVWTDAEGQIIYVNDEICRRLGYAREDLLRMFIWDINPRLSPESFKVLLDETKKSGFKKFETAHITRAGKEYPIDAMLVRLQWGETDLLCAYDRDLTEKKATQEFLRLTHFATDHAKEGIIWTNSAGKIIYVNHAVMDLLKYSREALLQMNAWDINPTYTPETWLLRYEESVRQGTLKYETVHRASDGTIIPLEAFVSNLTFNGNKYFCAYVRDVSERKRAEDALRESEANFRSIFDHAPIGVCKVALDFRFLEVNPEYCRITGYSEAELLQKTFPEITLPDDREMSVKPAVAMIEGKIDYYKLYKRYTRKDGQVIWVWVHGRILKNSEGCPQYFVAMVEDITEHKQMLDALLVTQKSVDLAADNIAWTNTSGQIVYVNDAICNTLGCSREELLAEEFFDFCMPQVREFWPKMLVRFREEWPFRMEMVWLSRDGRRIPLELALYLIASGSQELICVFARPVTDPGRAEKILAGLYRFSRYPSGDNPDSTWQYPSGGQ